MCKGPKSLEFIDLLNFREKLKFSKDHIIEITFLADSPFASRAESIASAASIPQLKNLDDVLLETISNKSRSSEGARTLIDKAPLSVNHKFRAQQTGKSSEQPKCCQEDECLLTAHVGPIRRKILSGSSQRHHSSTV